MRMFDRSTCARFGLFVLATLTVLLMVSPVTAQSEGSEATVSPDRPGFSNGTSIIPPGRFQLEAGANARFGDFTTTITPLNFLGRIGLGHVAELRVGATPVTINRFSGSGSVGGESARASETEASYLSSASLGAKFSTGLSKNIQIGVLPSFGLSNLTDEGTSGGLGIDGLLGIGGLGPVSLTVNVGVSDLIRVGTDGDVTDQLAVTGAASVGFSATDRLGFFLEPYVIVPHSGDSRIALDGGATYRLNSKLQLDFWGDVTLNRDHAATVGLGATYLF